MGELLGGVDMKMFNYLTIDKGTLEKFNSLLSYKELNEKDLELILKTICLKSSLRNVEDFKFPEDNKLIVARVKDLKNLFPFQTTKNTELCKEFRDEVYRTDSKIPSACYSVVCGIPLINVKAFYYFLMNRDLLLDSVQRKNVPPFDIKEINKVM